MPDDCSRAPRAGARPPSPETFRIRVLLTRPSHDSHDRGVRHLARRLRDAGFEVIFTDFLLPAEIVATAIQEDVDCIGVSSSTGGHLEAFEDLLRGLREAGAGDILLWAGGVIPDADAVTLRGWGVADVFGPGRSADEVIAFIRQRIPQAAGAGA
jgi:methylmalonyl-CoA mutase, C-terminal domain